jgi:hypothetical protein
MRIIVECAKCKKQVGVEIHKLCDEHKIIMLCDCKDAEIDRLKEGYKPKEMC